MTTSSGGAPSVGAKRGPTFASPICWPVMITFAPNFRHLSTLARGATTGMKTETGMPSCAPCQERARAWLPAEAAITPRFF